MANSDLQGRLMGMVHSNEVVDYRWSHHALTLYGLRHQAAAHLLETWKAEGFRFLVLTDGRLSSLVSNVEGYEAQVKHLITAVALDSIEAQDIVVAEVACGRFPQGFSAAFLTEVRAMQEAGVI